MQTIEEIFRFLSECCTLAQANSIDFAQLARLYDIYGASNYSFESTPPDEVLKILSVMQLKPAERVADAGAGAGHFVIPGAYLHPNCHFTAIEAAEERIDVMRRAAKRFGIKNLEIVVGDARMIDYGNFDHIFINNPFFPTENEFFVLKLAREGAQRQLAIYAINAIVEELRKSPTLHEIECEIGLPSYRFGVFRAGQSSSRCLYR